MTDIIIERHNGINVLRDDNLPGGTKSILMQGMINFGNEYVYATPVYGGFQIALSHYCFDNLIKATIFCAKRKNLHENTIRCKELGANVIEVDYGYLSVVEKAARDYCEKNKAIKLTFGANTMENKLKISERVRSVIENLGKEPEEIWCAIGSGTLVESIIMGTNNARIFGVQVGADFSLKHERLNVMKYHKTFDKISNFNCNFKSTKNYDLKAFEYCCRFTKSKDVLFWNVL